MLDQNKLFIWIPMFSMTILVFIHVKAVEIIEADYYPKVHDVGYHSNYDDWGQLLLIQINLDDEWKTFDIPNNKYYSEKPDTACQCYRENYEYARRNGYSYSWRGQCDDGSTEKKFRPTNLTIRAYASKKFPSGLFRPEIFSQLKQFRISELGVSEFHASMLSGATTLKTLDLSRNAIEELPSMAFIKAGNLVEINLSHNQIASMPSDVFIINVALRIPTTTTTTTTEKIRWNTPTTTPSSIYSSWSKSNEYPPLGIYSPLPDRMYPLENLRIIRLNNNRLTIIDPDWFRCLKSLETVTLNDNLLTEIDMGAVFQSNYALRSLYLQNNNFSSIITSVFTHQLDFFDISNNQRNDGAQTINISAKTINITNTNSRECFIPSNGVILHAGHNQLNSVEVEENLNTVLQELYLDHNQIHSVDFLLGLHSVKIIDLSHNSLEQLNANILENMQQLTTLDLSYNNFTSIDFAFIEPASSLVYLDISNNHLNGHFSLDIEANALTILSIANNNYTSVQQNLKKYAPNLVSIDLNGNYFDCDGLTSTILFLNFDRIRAITPIEDVSSLKGKDNVKGIRCHSASPGSELVGDRQMQDSPKRSYNVMKNDMNKSLNDKLAQLEVRLIEMFKNITESKTQNNKH